MQSLDSMMRTFRHILKMLAALLMTSCSRKSDIENERLPPDLYDLETPEGMALISSQPATPSEDASSPPSPNGVAAALEQVISGATSTGPPGAAPGSPLSPTSPTSPISSSTSPFRRGHGRQASLGTTMTSPSTRRRSLESTMSLIQEAWDGKTPEKDNELMKLADQVAGKSTGKNSSESGRTSPS